MTVKSAEPAIRKCLLILIILLIAFAVIEKAILFSRFSVRYTDEDQCVLWVSAGELMKGYLHEPCFYGQAYSSCLEGWLAVPFVWCGLEFYQAVPLVTVIMSTLPFLLLAGLFCRRRHYLEALMLLACLLLFSLDYKLISILPRGFITGVFGFGMGYYRLWLGGRHRFFWFSLLAFLGVALNETTFFLVFPAFCFLWKEECRNRSFYLQSALGLAIAGIYKLYTWLFYHVIHPDYNSYSKPRFEWNADYIQEIVGRPGDWFFGDFNMIVPGGIVVVALFLFKKQWLQAAIVLATAALLFASFGLDRVHDGTQSIFYSRSRFYVFMPMLFVVFAVACIRLYRPAPKIRLLIAFLFTGCIAYTCLVQQLALGSKIESEMQRGDKIVAVMPVKETFQKTYEYIAICRATHNPILAIDCATKETFILCNTIPLLSNNEIQAYQPADDRKTWVLKSLAGQQPEKILVYGNFDDRYHRETLAGYRRYVVRKAPDALVEYYLTKPLRQTLRDDFKSPIRAGTR